MRPTLPTSRFFRPTLEVLETRELPSSGVSGLLLSQSLGQLATDLGNALTILRSNAQNLSKDLSGSTGAPNQNILGDYAKTAFNYGQVQAFTQGINTLGKADLGFIAFAGGGSSQNTMLSALLSINSDISKANNDLNQALSTVNHNPSNDFLFFNFVSVLSALS